MRFFKSLARAFLPFLRSVSSYEIEIMKAEKEVENVLDKFVLGSLHFRLTPLGFIWCGLDGSDFVIPYVSENESVTFNDDQKSYMIEKDITLKDFIALRTHFTKIYLCGKALNHFSHLKYRYSKVRGLSKIG